MQNIDEALEKPIHFYAAQVKSWSWATCHFATTQQKMKTADGS